MWHQKAFLLKGTNSSVSNTGYEIMGRSFVEKYKTSNLSTLNSQKKKITTYTPLSLKEDSRVLIAVQILLIFFHPDVQIPKFKPHSQTTLPFNISDLPYSNDH